jgi:hypothetical protein
MILDLTDEETQAPMPSSRRSISIANRPPEQGTGDPQEVRKNAAIFCLAG